MIVIDWAWVASIADKVARSTAASWPIVEKDDVKQEILLHAYERRPLIEENYTEEFLWKFSRTAAKQYASKVRDARDVEDDRYYYTPPEARAILETFVYTDSELSASLGKKDDLLKCRITDNVVSARMDATNAINKLPKATREVLMRRYVYGLPPADDSERRAANRAVDALARQMNRDIRSR
ncbi:hypothetical protein C9F11_10050 [Streptomyces sp. YIM 121038]|uniref:hypothetical protein n=1 Tax=Streptomyces sp. YIM 121038 TaxID=2136401 RepID=UPI0011105228|nr:hypothetical protein [Streptomyces sp. YIM 121038]QCX75693.1 hypothetical protein C9F11_10050 [Streptomyces sp. YIM 121038]